MTHSNDSAKVEKVRAPDAAGNHRCASALGNGHNGGDAADPHAALRDCGLGPLEALELLPAAIYTTDNDGRITFYNAAAAEMWGREPALGELWCGSWRMFRLDGTPIPHEECPMAVTVREGRAVRGQELLVERPDGRRAYVLPHPRPLHDSRGRLVGALNMVVDVSEQHRADQARQESEQRFRRLADSAPVLIWQSDADKRGVYFNRQWLEFTGRSFEEELGEGWLQSVHPDDAEALDECARAFEERRPFTTQFRLRRHDGTYRWMLDSGEPRFSSSGEFAGFVGTCVDIHDRYLAERNLELYREVFANCADGIAIIDGEGRYLEQNAAHEQLIGYSDEELRGATPAVHLGEETFAAVARALREQGRWHGEVTSRTRDGSTLPLDVTAFAVRDAAGRPRCYVGIKRDISAKKQAERARRDAAARLEAVVATAVDGIITIDERGAIDSVNPAAERIFGYGEEELRGRNVKVLMPEPFNSRHDQFLANFLATGEKKIIGIGREVVGRRKDGATFPMDLAVSETWLGERRLFTGIVRDITGRKRAEQRILSEVALRRAVERSTPDGLAVFDDRGRLLHTNAAFCRMVGREEHELAGSEPPHAFWPPEERERMELTLQEILRGEAPREGHELRFMRASGERVDVLMRAQRVEAPGQLSGWLATVTDISNRKRVDEQVARLAAIVETCEDAIVRKDLDNTITDWNAAAERMFGFTREEAIGQPLSLIIPPERAHEPRELAERLMRGEPVHAFETQRRRKDGVLLDVSLTLSLIRDASGRPIAISGIERDVTAQKRAEAAWRESEGRFRQLAETIREVFYISEGGIVKYVSPAYEAVWGRSRESLYSDELSFAGAIHPLDRDRVLHSLRRQREGEATEERYRIRRPDGEQRWIWDRAYPVTDEAGRVVRIFGIAEDVTERVETDNALRFLGEASSELAANLDYQATLASLARLAVPRFADWCAVDLLDDQGRLRRLAVAHEDPSKVELAEQLHERYPPDLDASLGLGAVLRTGEPQMLGAISDELLVEHARDREHLRLLRELGLRSYICVPLAAQGRILGVLTFVSAESERRYTQRDLEFAAELARRAGTAIDNAALHAEVRASEERFRQLADAMPQIVWTAGADGRIDYFNERYYSYTGRARGDTENSTLLHAEGRDEMRQRWQRSIDSGLPFQGEIRIYQAESGEFRWHLVRAVPVRDDHGRIVKWFGTSTDIHDLKAAQAALEQSEARLSLAMEAGRMGVWEWDAGLQSVRWSPNLERIHGFEPGTFGGAFEDFQRAIHPDDRPRVLRSIQTSLEQQTLYHVEYRMVRPDGRQAWVEARGRVLLGEDGRARGMTGICADVTDRKLVEEVLKQRLRELAIVYRLSSEIALARDLDGVFRSAIDAVLDATSADRAALLLFDEREVMRFCAWRGLSDRYREAVEGHSPWRPEAREVEPILVADAREDESMADLRDLFEAERIGALAFVPVSYEGRLLGKFMLYCRDAHAFSAPEVRLAQTIANHVAVAVERARSEAALRDSEERFRAVAETVPDVIWVADGQMNWTYVNPRFEAVTGRRAGDAGGRGWLRAVHPDDVQQVEASVQRALDEGETCQIELRLQAPGGAFRWFVVRAQPIHDEQGRLVRWYGSCTDVDDLKRAKEQNDLLVGELNHRVKNAMATVLSIADQTARNAADLGQFKPAFEGRMTALSHAHNLLSQTRWRGASLGALVAEILAPFGGDGRDRITLAGPEIAISPRAALTLTLAIHELATNAAKYGALSTPDGEVAVRWQRTGGDSAPGSILVEWSERGGPPVRPPSRRGFGARLLQRSVSYELGGEVVHEFDPAGVRCAIRLPISAIGVQPPFVDEPEA